MNIEMTLQDIKTMNARFGICDDEPLNHIPHSLIEWDEERQLYRPKFPINRLIYEGEQGHSRNKCAYCGSSLKRKRLFWRSKRCIQPECFNSDAPNGADERSQEAR